MKRVVTQEKSQRGARVHEPVGAKVQKELAGAEVQKEPVGAEVQGEKGADIQEEREAGVQGEKEVEVHGGTKREPALSNVVSIGQEVIADSVTGVSIFMINLENCRISNTVVLILPF